MSSRVDEAGQGEDFPATDAERHAADGPPAREINRFQPRLAERLQQQVEERAVGLFDLVQKEDAERLLAHLRGE